MAGSLDVLIQLQAMPLVMIIMSPLIARYRDLIASVSPRALAHKTAATFKSRWTTFCLQMISVMYRNTPQLIANEEE